MTVLVGLLPALVLLGAALLYSIPLPASWRIRRWIPIFACAVAVWSLITAAQAPEPLTLLPGDEALPALSLTLQWSGVALPAGILLLVILTGRFLYGLETDDPGFVFGSLTAVAGALLFLAADNFTMVATAWILVELGLLVIPAGQDETHSAAAHAFGWNLAAIVVWLTAGIVLSNEGSSLRLAEITIGGASGFLILLAVWIRSGIYPLHTAAPANSNTLGMRMGLPLLLGGYLMTRLLLQTQSAPAFDDEMEILALVAVGVSALVVVGQFHGSDALMWMLRGSGALLLLLPFFVGARLAPILSLWFALGAFATCHFVEIAMRWRSELPNVRLTLFVWIVALVMVAGLPLGPIFWARVGLLDSAYEQTGVALWLLLVAGTSFLLVPVWREIFASRDVAPRAPSLSEYAALACVLFPSLALSIVPSVLIAPFGGTAQARAELAYGALFRPDNFASFIFLLAGLFVPLLASFELARRWDPRTNLLPVPLTNVLDLSAVVVPLDAAYRFLRVLLQQSLALLEQPPVAWLIFLAIWVAVWLRALGT